MMPPGNQGASSENNLKNMNVSEYKNVQLNKSTCSTKVPSESVPLTYAAATQSITFPTKEQAVIMDAIDGVAIKEFTLAIAKVISPGNIRFVSRVSNGRICMYLANQHLVEKLTDTDVNTKVANHTLRIRPLVSRAKRIILSNVCPIIPHEAIESKLLTMGIRCASHLIFIRAGMNEPGFSHILSFQRQIYIEPSDANKLPDSIQIEYENVDYWIYISSDSPRCFICKKDGHLAKQCPIDNNTVHMSLSEKPSINKEKGNTLEEVIAAEDNSKVFEPETNNYERNDKRPLSTTESSSIVREIVINDNSSSDDTDNKINQEQILKSKRTKGKKTIKKRRTESCSSEHETDIETMTLPIKAILTQRPNTYVLDYINFNSILRETIGNPNHLEIAKKYTDDIKGLSNMLHDIYPSLTHRSVKNRLSRIIKKLREGASHNGKKNWNNCSGKLTSLFVLKRGLSRS
ncbi:uncharacterized protein LOC128891237 [Hylaeus anthracinus]|uniref:uncharacterized protein LOC128891237 n=1 Tax=Hylaeus anthracinus TaxID=313031 RepID=UPI0023B89392|nr:uncharacterized protein LOC128891237 [Hylaeus anthracinus]